MNFNDYARQSFEFFQRGKFDLAKENLEKALEIQPDNADLRRFLGNIGLAIEARVQEANATADEAKERAKILELTDGITDVDRAIVEYTEALKRDPSDSSAKITFAALYYIRGLTHASKEEHVRAIAAFTEALKHNPDHLFALNRRGREHSKNGNFDEAIADFEELFRLNPDYPRVKSKLAGAYSERGRSYGIKGDDVRAIPDFKKALEFTPDDGNIRKMLELSEAAAAKGKK
ncbi:MAG: tetratricopeptide repeat protein [Spirochaetaceae bacterium]|nr:tetratricopeptide repeat protein [Spirochaetaceae bacterium]